MICWNQLFELGPCPGLIRVRRIPQETFDGFIRQHAAVEERLENRVVQRLHRLLVVLSRARRARVAEAAGEQQVGELGDQILEIQFVQLVAGVLGVLVFHPKP